MQSPIAPAPQRFLLAIAVLVLLLGSTVLIGWWADLGILLQVLPDAAAMKANTAAAFVLGGLGLLAAARPQLRRLLPWCAGGMVLLGALQLLQAVAGVDLGIDQLLARDHSGDADSMRGNAAGRMSPVGAACILFGGVSLLLHRWPTRRRVIVGQVLAAALIVIGFNAVTGYISRVPGLYRMGGGSSMALHSAIGFVLLGVGMLLTNDRHGIGLLLAEPGAGGHQLRRILPAVTLGPLLMHAAAVTGYLSNWYGGAVLNSMLTTGNACVLAAVTIWTSRRALLQETARARLLLELAERETQLRVRDWALASTITGVAITDARRPDQPIVYVNRAFTHITGYASDEVLGRNCRFLNDGVREQPGLDELRAAIAAGRPCVVQLRNRRKDGTEFWNRLSVSPVHDPGGELTHWIGVQENISSQIAAAEERETLLRAAVDDRRRAERASRARDALLAVVSHELRSPLNAMRLWSSLLTKQPDAATVQRAARQIELNIAAQSRLIGDLVDVSRIESGRLELQQAPVDFAALVERVFESLRPTGVDKGLTVRLLHDGSQLTVEGDAGRLEQVLRNLLDNAIKFTEAKGHVEVALARTDGHARLRVSDTGKGMTPAQQEHAFELFWQGDREDTRAHGGLGLGLYLVRQIVERHGGTIAGSSAGVGRGSTFELQLPLTAVSASRPAAVADGVGGRNGVADILVVDDEISTVEGLALALRYRGYPVRMASNAAEALDMIHRQRPRVLLSDIMMPEKSGVELIAAVRQEERRSAADDEPLHAIAMSGRGSPSDRRRLLHAGFDDYLQKPIDIDHLIARIDAGMAKNDD